MVPAFKSLSQAVRQEHFPQFSLMHAQEQYANVEPYALELSCFLRAPWAMVSSFRTKVSQLAPGPDQLPYLCNQMT